MEDDSRTVKELVMAILSKSKDTLPQLALLTQHIQRLSNGRSNSPSRVKKKDCLNPTFLIRLSQCGQNIRLIITHALSLQFQGKQTLKRYYNEYMNVIYDIRKYHEQAHKSYDMHKNSTQMKSSLLEELQLQTQRREALEAQLQRIMEEHQRQVNLRDQTIQELESKVGDRSNMDISHISRISRQERGMVLGQLYAGDQKTGKIDEEYQVGIQTARLRKKIHQLEHQLSDKESQHQKELDYHKLGILQLQGKFQELMKTTNLSNQSLKVSSFNNTKRENKSLKPSDNPFESSIEEGYRMIVIQALTIEQFLNQQEQ